MAERDSHRPTLPGELAAAAEWQRLRADPVYRGIGVPRGDRRRVAVLPGLFGNDFYLGPMRRWLGLIGYRSVASGLAINAGCSERLSREIEARLERIYRREKGPIALIGHSRGGILARAIAARWGGRVSHLVLLGSPVGGLLRLPDAAFRSQDGATHANSRVVEVAKRARRFLDPDCAFPACGCAFTTDLRRTLAPATLVLSIRSADDAIVAPESCVVADGRNLEVRGTHTGLVFNPDVYRLLAEHLAR